MRFRPLALLGALALLALSGSARADYTYEFTDANGNAESSFTVGVGQTVTVGVYIVETTTTNLATEGLFSAGVQLNTTNTAVANVTAVAANPQFTGGSSTGTGANAYISEFAAGTAPNSVTAPSSGPNANSILVGTFTFTGVSAGQTVTVTGLPGLNPDNVLGDGQTSIDSNLENNATSAVITVAAVPEPGPLYLTGLAVPLIGAGAWLRLRRRTPTAVA